jgi:hypothetical protein
MIKENKGFSLEAFIFFMISAIAAYFLFFRDSEKKWPPGILVDSAPIQINLESSKVLDLKGYTIATKAEFKMTARVLAEERYHFDDGADLVPVDLALGWLEMSDQSVLDELKISQSRRFYFWKTRGNDLPVQRDKIEHNSANMHMIPSTEEIEKTLKVIERGDIISFEGYLADISHKNGFSRHTSMTRTDNGPGACEIVYLTALNIDKVP